MGVDVILGLQWGDEGKGKVVDYLSQEYQLVCRFQGGPNAGHTIVIGDKKHVLHTIPSGIFRSEIINLIGNGVVIDPITLMREIDNLHEAGLDIARNLRISRKAHLILPTHRYLDKASEASKGKSKIGSTLKGIGPTYMDKTGRNGLRYGDISYSSFKGRYDTLKGKHLGLLKLYEDVEFDLASEEEKWFAAINRLLAFEQVDGEYFVNEALYKGKKVLAEGAQGSMLDIDFGTYPFVTSSNTVTSGVCSGLGIAPSKIGEVIGISKAYCTRVGGGPFPTELDDEDGDRLRSEGKEFGATTGRPRRCGWIDIPQLKYTIMINGVTQIVLTKLDVLNIFDQIGICNDYSYADGPSDQIPYDLCENGYGVNINRVNGWKTDLGGIKKFADLPINAREYVELLERQLDVPITIISVGPERDELIFR